MVDYLQKYGISMPPIGSYFIAAFSVTVSYAIVKHQVLDFAVVVRHTVVYSVLIALITAVYFCVVLFAERSLQGILGYRSVVASLLAGFTIALSFNPLKEVIQRAIDQLFFKGTQVMLAEQNERLRQELTQSEKLKAVSTLAAGMAHEIKNPLTALKTFAEYLPQKYDDPEYREKFTRIVTQEVDKMNGLVKRLLDFAKPEAPQLRNVRLGQIISETLELIQENLLHKHAQVILALEYQETIQADPTQLKQALFNILLNSLDALEPGGRITISAARANGHVQISVQDTGRGIPKADLNRALDPFFTTKPEGTGLGLTVVDSIIRAHGGRMRLESEAGRGTTVQFTLPLK
jgi:signal transduction histidine kinase